MKAIDISNTKKFTQALFAGDDFDTFAVAEAKFDTLIHVEIDGHTNPEFLEKPEDTVSSETAACEKGIALWTDVRKLCYQVVSGKRLPVRFKVVLMVPKDKTESFLKNSGVMMKASDVGALSLNIKYEAGKISCVTGTALKTFTMDKSLEEAWDASMQKFLAKFC